MDILRHINVLAELERYGLPVEWSGTEEVRTRCPFHEDTSPSCCINVEKRVFYCPVAGCMAKGDILDFLAGHIKQTRGSVFAELAKRYSFEVEPGVETDVVEMWHTALWQAFPLLAELRKRGVTDALIRKYRLGENEGRVMIPVRNAYGTIVNVRKYLPGAPGKDKMRNMKGRSKPRWFPHEQLKYEKIVVCGGEMKAAVAAEQLNQHGIGAVTPTDGEKVIARVLLDDLKGKVVYHCLDIDDAGREGAEHRCRQTSGIAAETWLCELPLDKEKYPKGDVNDFVAQEHGDLMAVLDAATLWVDRKDQLVKEDPIDVPLVAATHADMSGRRVKVKAIVAACGQAPYAIPREVRARCDRDQPYCALCPVFSSKGDTFTIDEESPALLQMIDASKKTLREAVMDAVGVPHMCRVVMFEALSHYHAEDVRVAPQLEVTERASDRAMQPAVCIGVGLQLNESYEFTGKMLPHPATQQTTLLASRYDATKDALSNFEFTDEMAARLAVFQPDDWTDEALARKLDEVYEDFESNVTRIFRRRDMHLMVDLAYHSPLLFEFDGRTTKGWVEVLVVGDSSCGKSEVACGARGDGGLMTHYGLGVKVEMKNASVAGLLGGLQNLSGKFFVTWGVTPTHDQRLVIYEEVKGAAVEVLSKLTDMRSSGVATLAKIESRRAHARTRGVWNSNPRSDREVSTYNFGVEVVKELMGSPEDVRRFDAALVVSNKDVTPDELNVLQSSRPSVEHRFTSELCRELVLWAWTRNVADVEFQPESTALILQSATALCDRFTDKIPLVDRGSTRLKLARLAASLACRTFSCDETGRVIVRPCHVRHVCEFLSKTYGGKTAGYKDYTEAQRVTQTLQDPEGIKRYVAAMPHPRDFVKSILYANYVDSQDIQDWCSWDRTTASDALSYFVRKHALTRLGRTYVKNPQFIELLKYMLSNGCLRDRPGHVEEPGPGDKKEY